jgi:serine/threonine-protein kinase
VADAADYAATWDGAAASFQARVPKDRWVETLRNIRLSLGTVVSREHVATRPEAQIEGAPPGHYVVIENRIRFESGQSFVETVIASREDAGWKVAGYLVRAQ